MEVVRQRAISASRLQSRPVFAFQVGEGGKSAFTKMRCSKSQKAHHCFCCQSWEVFLARDPQLDERSCLICFCMYCQWIVWWAYPPLVSLHHLVRCLRMETVSMSHPYTGVSLRKVFPKLALNCLHVCNNWALHEVRALQNLPTHPPMETWKNSLTRSLHLKIFLRKPSSLSYRWLACVLGPCIELLSLFSSEKTSTQYVILLTQTSPLTFAVSSTWFWRSKNWIDVCANTVLCESHQTSEW